MLKKDLEEKLGKTLSNQEYNKIVYAEFMKNRKPQAKKQKNEKKETPFVDSKEEFLATVTDSQCLGKDYYKKSYEYALKFDDNFLLFQKPSIETHFCFGYGQNGISTEDDWERAAANRDYASSNEKYFLDENLKGLNEQIETLTCIFKTEKMSWEEKNKFYNDLYSKTKNWLYAKLNNSIVKFYLCKNRDNTCYMYTVDSPEDENRLQYKTVLKELSKEELTQILAVYKQQKENFIKRLNTYLKRYGLSKLHTWTYLVD